MGTAGNDCGSIRGVGTASRCCRVLLYSKPGCHLCDDARPLVARVCDELAVGWEEVDISSDAELMRRFGEQIPVVYVDGRPHDFWRVEEERLRRALAGG